MSVDVKIYPNTFGISMSLEINDNMNISVVQATFNRAFPYLKLEFYEKDYANSKKIIPKTIYNNSRLLKEFNVSKNINTIAIHADMTVSELADSFNRNYALVAKVFRRSGNVWLSTSVTDGWSLYEQNKQGELITAQMTDNK